MTVDEQLDTVLAERQTTLATLQAQVARLQTEVTQLMNLQTAIRSGTLTAAQSRRLVEYLRKG